MLFSPGSTKAMQECKKSQVRNPIAPDATVVPASSTRAITGRTFRRLVESLLRVPYRAVRESGPRKSGKGKEPEQQASQPESGAARNPGES